MQGFNWESCKGRNYYKVLAGQAPAIAAAGYTSIWLPPPSDAVAPQGYLPRDLYQLNSSYGTENELRDCIKELKRWNLKVIADIVINHRCAHTQVCPDSSQHFGNACRITCFSCSFALCCSSSLKDALCCALLICSITLHASSKHRQI
jgi:alpha-amylase